MSAQGSPEGAASMLDPIFSELGGRTVYCDITSDLAHELAAGFLDIVLSIPMHEVHGHHEVDDVIRNAAIRGMAKLIRDYREFYGNEPYAEAMK